jgi:hypothetical protein
VRDDWRTRLASRATGAPLEKNPKPKLTKPRVEPPNLGPWNAARNWTLKARMDEDPEAVLENWEAADAAARSLAEQGYHVNRSKVDTARQWAVKRLASTD